MLKISYLSVVFLIGCNSVSTYASERDDWQQFRAQKGMEELEAQFAKPEPEVRVETKIVERIVIKEVIKEVPVAAPIAVADAVPEPVAKPRPSHMSSDSLDGLTYTIRETKLEGDDLTVKFQVFSPDKDRVIGVRKASIWVDGDEYSNARLNVGKSTGYGLASGITIPGDLKVNGAVVFKSVPKNTTSLDMLRIYIGADKVSFKNVAVN